MSKPDPALAPIAVDVETGAAAMGISPSVLRGWIERGLLPVVKYPSTRRIGEQSRRVLVAVDDLRAFVLKHREDPNDGDPRGGR